MNKRLVHLQSSESLELPGSFFQVLLVIFLFFLDSTSDIHFIVVVSPAGGDVDVFPGPKNQIHSPLYSKRVLGP